MMLKPGVGTLSRGKGRSMRSSHFRSLPVVLLALTLAGCGDSSGSSPEAPAARLELSVTLTDGGVPQEATLTCPGNGTTGYLAEMQDACTVVEDVKDVLSTLPPEDQICTMEYGGPQRATVTGEVDGEDIQRTFLRNDGCRIQEWDSLVPLLPAASP